MSNFDVQSLIGEIDVLRSDEYVNLPGCLNGVDIPKDQLNTVIHEVMHLILDLPVANERPDGMRPTVLRERLQNGRCISTVLDRQAIGPEPQQRTLGRNPAQPPLPSPPVH